jgi:hypothetical protein
MAKTFNDLIDKAALFVEQPLSFTKDNFIKEVEEYVKSLPEKRRNAIIGYIVPPDPNSPESSIPKSRVKAVRYYELPQVLRSDEDFFRRYVNALAKMKKLSIKK